MNYFDVADGKVTGLDYNMFAEFKMSDAEYAATLKYTLDLRLRGNRAPFMFGGHSVNYKDAGHLQALADFVEVRPLAEARGPVRPEPQNPRLGPQPGAAGDRARDVWQDVWQASAEAAVNEPPARVVHPLRPARARHARLPLSEPSARRPRQNRDARKGATDAHPHELHLPPPP